MKSPSLGFVGILLLAVSGSVAAADPPSGVLKEEPISESQFVPWGNLQGMRVRGEWVPFEAGVRVVRSDWSGFSGAVKYLQRPEYSRAGNQRTVVSSIDGVGLRNVIGGNFRLQFPKTDPAVIQYCLENLPVTWGRNDLPWAEWHPVEDEDPLALARSGKLHPRVSAAMDMVRTLEKRGIPMIVSVWSVPRWARADHQPPGLRGIALHEGKQPAIADSLAKALVFLKEQYGVEAAFFSLNEPETGVEVRQTAIEHREFMLAMGRELAKHNLATRRR